MSIIPTLEPEIRQIAIDSWQSALRTVFIVQSAVAVLALFSAYAIEEFDLPYANLFPFLQSEIRINHWPLSYSETFIAQKTNEERENGSGLTGSEREA